MALHVHIERQVVAWLRERPELIDSFSDRLSTIRSDELTLMRETQAILFKGRRYMQRCFIFGGEYLAAFEWNQAERSIRLHECRRAPTLPRAA